MHKMEKKCTKIKGFVISKKPPLFTFILCIIAAVLNLVLSEFTSRVIKFPLFLDTLFSITLLFYCGILPAIFSSFLYSIPSSLLANMPFYLLFNFCAIAIFLITYGIMKKNEKNNNSLKLTILYLILASLLSGFVSSILGGIIHTFGLILYPDDALEIVTEKFVLSLFSKNGNLFLSSILGRIPTTCIDRIICTLLGYGLYKLLEKVEKKLR